MGWFSKSKRSEQETERVTLKTGGSLQCLLCRGERFRMRNAKLVSPGAALFDMEWISPVARCAICKSCGFVHWFADPE